MNACADEMLCCSAALCSPWYKFISLPSLPPSKSVSFGHLTSGIVLSEQEEASALSQEKWRSGMRGSLCLYARA